MRTPTANRSLSKAKLRYRLSSLGGRALKDDESPPDDRLASNYLSQHRAFQQFSGLDLSASSVDQSIYFLTSSSLPDFDSSQRLLSRRKQTRKPRLIFDLFQSPNQRQAATKRGPSLNEHRREGYRSISQSLSIEKANLNEQSLLASPHETRRSVRSVFQRVQRESTREDLSSEEKSIGPSESMTRYDRDVEYEAYLDEKRLLSDKLHDHWKKDLIQHKLERGKPLNKINDKIYKSNQWITIVNSSRAQTAARTTSDRISSLVETFAGEVDSDSKMNRYQVNDQVGVMIAQKLESGQRLRVGRNGEEVSPRGGPQDSDIFSDVKKSDFVTREQTPKSILSWKDQVKLGNIKIIEAKMSIEKQEKREKPERTLIVKKLIDEEEFQPEKRKKPVIMEQKNSLEIVGSSPPQSNQSQRVIRIPVEIVGVRPSTTNQRPFNILEAKETNASRNGDEGNENEEDDEAERTEKPRLVPKKAKKKGVGEKLGEALEDEAKYERIIDNLTDRLAAGNPKPTAKTKTSPKKANPKPQPPLVSKYFDRRLVGNTFREIDMDPVSQISPNNSPNRSRPSTSNPLHLEIMIPPAPPQSSQSQPSNYAQKPPPLSQPSLQSYGGGYYFINATKPQTAGANLLPNRRIGIANKLDQSKRYNSNSQSMVTNYFSMVKHVAPKNRARSGMTIPIDFFASETNSKDTYRNNAPPTPLTDTR